MDNYNDACVLETLTSIASAIQNATWHSAKTLIKVAQIHT
jgi:hypothetical protein